MLLYFLCSFIKSQYSTTMAMTTTPLMTMVSSGMSSLSSFTMALSLMGLPATLGQHDVLLPPLLTPRHSGGAAGPATVLQQQPPSQMALQAYANNAMGPPQVGFFFRVEPPTILHIILLVSVLVSAFCCQVPCWMPYSPTGAQQLGCEPLQPFGAYQWQAYVQPGNGHWPTQDMHRVIAPSTTLSRRSVMLLNQLFPAIPTIWGAYSFGGLAESHLILHLPCIMGRGLLF